MWPSLHPILAQATFFFFVAKYQQHISFSYITKMFDNLLRYMTELYKFLSRQSFEASTNGHRLKFSAEKAMQDEV